MPRLVFVNRVCWPEEEATAQLLINLVDGLAHLGWDCHVISGSSGGGDRPGNRVTFHQMPRNKSASPRGLIAKAISYRRFTASVSRFLPGFLLPEDRVVAMTDPPLIGVKIAAIVQKHDACLWHWAQDIYPEVAMAITDNPLLKMGLRRLIPARNRSWDAAEHIVTIGEDLAELIRQESSRPVSIIPNWYPRALAESLEVDFRRKWQIPPKHLLVVYSGNLGRAHILTPILTIARQCQCAQAPIRFVFVGNGAQKEALRREAQRLKIANVSFQPPVPRPQLDSLLQTADVHLVTMRPACRGTVLPSKFYGIVAAGKPCIFLGPDEGDLPTQIRENRLGIACDPTEVSAAVSYLLKLADNPDGLNAACRSVERHRSSQPNAGESAEAWHQTLRGQLNTIA